MNNKTLNFHVKDAGELDAFCALVAALQYHSVKFTVDKDGFNYSVSLA